MGRRRDLWRSRDLGRGWDLRGGRDLGRRRDALVGGGGVDAALWGGRLSEGVGGNVREHRSARGGKAVTRQRPGRVKDVLVEHVEAVHGGGPTRPIVAQDSSVKILQ